MNDAPLQLILHRALSKKDARAITDRIKARMADVVGEVARAYIGRVWIALGYKSWSDYIASEFEHAPIHLPRDERRAVVELLRGHGMSQRAIGAATGADQATISRDLAGDANASGEPASQITGRDGKTYKRPTPPQPGPKKRRENIDEPKSGYRPGATRYSKAIQRCSASMVDVCETLTDEQLAEALGAAQWLYELLRGATIIRQRKVESQSGSLRWGTRQLRESLRR